MPTKLMILITTFLLIARATPAEFAEAAEPVTVRLLDGREFTASVDARSDQQKLWLRYGHGTILLLRPIRWDRIAEAERKGKPVSVEQLRLLASEASSDATTLDRFTPATPTPATPGTATPGTAPSDGMDEPIVQSSERPDWATGLSDADLARHALGFVPRVRAVQFDAQLANWDADVEADGLLLQLYPLDNLGRLTPVQGTLEAELVVMRRRALNEAPQSRGATPQRLGNWTVRVDIGHFNLEGAVIELPFQTAHPEFDTDWANHGLVHIRLVVPGHGVFEDSQDGLRIRPYAPLRDALERGGRQRFLPGETTGRGRRS